MPHRPWILSCYHKGGTVLLVKVFSSVAEEFGLRSNSLLGKPDQIPRGLDVVVCAHSLMDLGALPGDFRGVRLIRDPRDVVVSGYLYHLRTDERWCTNTDFDLTGPIGHPRVPHAVAHRPEEWKRAYLRALGGQSYQERLRALPQEDGLLFELDHYGSWTLESMAQWRSDPRILEVRFESIMEDFDRAFSTIFRHLGLKSADFDTAMGRAREHDLARKSDDVLAADPHVSSRSTTRWAEYLSERHRRLFKQRHGHLLMSLGYESGLDW